MTSTLENADHDPRLLASHDLALAALTEITPAETIGPAADYRAEADGVVSLRFENRLGGYPGWYWTVSLARVDDAAPTVLEVELLPGEGALLAPEWVPWSVRLAEYQAQQAAAEADESEGDGDEDEDTEVDDLDDLDAADYDTDGSPILHAGDVDGVDIDTLDDSEDDDSEGDDERDDDERDDDGDTDTDGDVARGGESEVVTGADRDDDAGR